MNTLFFKLLLLSLSVPLFTGGYSLLTESSATPGDPKLALEQINKFYTVHPDIYQEVSYHLFADHQTTIPYSIDKGIFIKHGVIQYSQLSTIESLTTKDYTIGIDHDEKLIMIANHISLPATNPVANAESWVSSSSDITLKPVSDRLQALTIKMEYGEIEQADIIFDINSFQPVKIIMHYRRSIQLEADSESPLVQPRLEIEYTLTSFEIKEKERLNINAYLIYKNKQWTLSPKFREYELINNIREFPVHN